MGVLVGLWASVALIHVNSGKLLCAFDIFILEGYIFHQLIHCFVVNIIGFNREFGLYSCVGFFRFANFIELSLKYQQTLGKYIN